VQIQWSNGGHQAVSSTSLPKWERERSAELDRSEAAHAAAARAAGRQPWATQQIDEAYAMRLSAEVRTHDARNSTRLKRLETLCEWRNAIAHQDFRAEFDPEALMLSLVRSFDRVVGRHLANLAGGEP
jgi:hypothetical protein